MALHRTVAEISLDAISSNLEQVRLRTGRRKILAVVKASAYGHGAVPVAKRLILQGIDMLGTATVEEGIELRDAGITHPILVLSGINPEEIPYLIAHNLTPVIYSFSLAKLLSEESKKTGKSIRVHVKIDTGMGRFGIIAEEAIETIKKLSSLKGLVLEGIMTHFSDADLSDKGFAEYQLKRFNKAIEGLKSSGINFPICHAANSAAILTFGHSHLDMVRPGIMLYGYLPSDHVVCPDLHPSLTLKSRILSIKKVPAGTPISYGRTFVTRRESLIAILPIGYADGYNRLLSNKGEAIIKGKRVPVIGRICMDTTMVDVTDIPEINEGDEAVLLGRQGDESIFADEIAVKTGTIPYEVLCSISRRVPRVYKK